uniref:Uncharacterized protein n=1 Tax=Klebsiella pneumoniae TaxID=573 RepID=A0A6M6A7H9_KLEPN|nr:hypothetical protein [Klebsiella pneumoniae]QJX13427.1 hypothetical protein [Klebsiella pneumoniae]
MVNVNSENITEIDYKIDAYLIKQGFNMTILKQIKSMNSGINKSVLIFRPCQEVRNILLTVRIITIIPCVNVMLISKMEVTGL